MNPAIKSKTNFPPTPETILSGVLVGGGSSISPGGKSLQLHWLRKMTTKQNMNFWKKVDKTHSCWVWKGCRNKVGYGTFCFNGFRISTHRIAYFMAHKNLSSKPMICHKCENPSCVRYDHLYAGTASENELDKYRYKNY